MRNDKKVNPHAKKHNLYFWVSLFLAAAILILSVIPGFGGGINSGSWAHGIAYFVLSLAIGFYFLTGKFNHPRLKGALLAGLYGALIEFVQFFIPYRDFDFGDILSNFMAAFFAIVPMYIIARFKKS